MVQTAVQQQFGENWRTHIKASLSGKERGIIIKLYCHIQRALHDELEGSLAMTHILPIYTIK